MTAGVCVTVSGEVVAWFKELDEAAEEWCSERYFGRWLISPAAAAPQPREFTAEERASVAALVGDMLQKIRLPKIAD